jgi:hypothetical protein
MLHRKARAAASVVTKIARLAPPAAMVVAKPGTAEQGAASPIISFLRGFDPSARISSGHGRGKFELPEADRKPHDPMPAIRHAIEATAGHLGEEAVPAEL